jgi:hypothetical protein
MIERPRSFRPQWQGFGIRNRRCLSQLGNSKKLEDPAQHQQFMTMVALLDEEATTWRTKTSPVV